MYKCCIFDLDGTLVNSIYAIQKSVNDTLSYWNMREISVEESRLYVGDGYMRKQWSGIRLFSGNAVCTVWKHMRESGSFCSF